MNLRLRLRSPHGTHDVSAPWGLRKEKRQCFTNPLTIKHMRKFLIMTVVMTSMVMASCNVTRTITTKSEYWQKADTSVIIQTKTIETYDASQKGL